MNKLFCLIVVLGCFVATHSAAAEGDAKLFGRAKDAFAGEKYAEAAMLCWRYLAKSSVSDEKYESAQFFLAASLEKLGLHHAAAEYYVQVAANRRSPILLPRAVEALETLSLNQPIDEGLVLRDLIGDSDFGDTLPDPLDDFVAYWQGVSNLERNLDQWTSERLEKIDHRGYYYFAALYVASVRLLAQTIPTRQQEALRSFAEIFGSLDLAAALESLRRRGESDSALTLALKAMLNDDSEIDIQFADLPKNWAVELAMLGFARIGGETEILLQRASETDDEELGRPFSYAVDIGGIPIYRRTPRYEDRSGAIRAIATREKAVAKIRGKALHSLARLLYEQQRFASTYDTLGQIPKHSEADSDILLERAWAKYKAGDPHRAMGLLYALDAPAFSTLFAPEKYVLRGLIYRRFCHFRAAKQSAQYFREQWAPALSDIRQGKAIARITPIRAAALHKPRCQTLHRLHTAVTAEQLRLKKTPQSWKQAGLSDHLGTLYTQEVAHVTTQLDQCLAEAGREIAEEMLRTEEQVNLLEYEVGQAIFQRVSERGTGTLHKTTPKIPMSSARTYFRFQDEYWTDELPNYKFHIEDRCVD